MTDTPTDAARRAIQAVIDKKTEDIERRARIIAENRAAVEACYAEQTSIASDTAQLKQAIATLTGNPAPDNNIVIDADPWPVRAIKGELLELRARHDDAQIELERATGSIIRCQEYNDKAHAAVDELKTGLLALTSAQNA